MTDTTTRPRPTRDGAYCTAPWTYNAEHHLWEATCPATGERFAVMAPFSGPPVGYAFHVHLLHPDEPTPPGMIRGTRGALPPIPGDTNRDVETGNAFPPEWMPCIAAAALLVTVMVVLLGIALTGPGQ